MIKKITFDQLQEFMKQIGKCKQKKQIQRTIIDSKIEIQLWMQVLEDLRPICSPHMKNILLESKTNSTLVV